MTENEFLKFIGWNPEDFILVKGQEAKDLSKLPKAMTHMFEMRSPEGKKMFNTDTLWVAERSWYEIVTEDKKKAEDKLPEPPVKQKAEQKKKVEKPVEKKEEPAPEKPKTIFDEFGIESTREKLDAKLEVRNEMSRRYPGKLVVLECEDDHNSFTVFGDDVDITKGIFNYDYITKDSDYGDIYVGVFKTNHKLRLFLQTAVDNKLTCIVVSPLMEETYEVGPKLSRKEKREIRKEKRKEASKDFKVSKPVVSGLLFNLFN